MPVCLRMSPDERWLAFSATDAGETHVYVATFPNLDRTVRISTSQGADPHGRELYYVTLDRTLMAVNVEIGESLEVGAPVPLFNAPLDPRSLASSSAYAPAADGQRFLLAEAADQEAPRLHVRMSWDVQSPALRHHV